MSTERFTIRKTTTTEIIIEVDRDEYDDPEQRSRVAIERAIERRDEPPGPKSWWYHDQTFKIV